MIKTMSALKIIGKGGDLTLKLYWTCCYRRGLSKKTMLQLIGILYIKAAWMMIPCPGNDKQLFFFRT